MSKCSPNKKQIAKMLMRTLVGTLDLLFRSDLVSVFVAGVGLVSGAKINPGHREKPFLKSIILMESKFCWRDAV